MTKKLITCCPFCGKHIPDWRMKKGVTPFRAWGFLMDFSSKGRGRGKIETLMRFYPNTESFGSYRFMMMLKRKLISIVKVLFDNGFVSQEDLFNVGISTMVEKIKYQLPNLFEPKKITNYPQVHIKKHESIKTDLNDVFKKYHPVKVKDYESVVTEGW